MKGFIISQDLLASKGQEGRETENIQTFVLKLPSTYRSVISNVKIVVGETMICKYIKFSGISQVIRKSFP